MYSDILVMQVCTADFQELQLQHLIIVNKPLQPS